MTDDEVDEYVRFLCAHLPPEQAHLGAEQVRAVLDAEAEYFVRRFGPIRGWRALLRSMFGRGDPAPHMVEQALPEFEEYVADALAGRADISREDIRAVMRVEGEEGPRWRPPEPAPPEPREQEEDEDDGEQRPL